MLIHDSERVRLYNNIIAIIAVVMRLSFETHAVLKRV